MPAIDAAKASGAAALNVLATPLAFVNRQIIIEHTGALRLPAVYQWPEIAEDGGLVAYGPRIVQIFRQVGRLLVKVLRGAKPADLPVEQPTNFELVINLRTAKAIGHDVPAALVLRADKVIGHRVRLRWDDRWGYWPRIEIPTVRGVRRASGRMS